MLQDVLISVIVPVYKVESYLDKCVSSICNQTYRKLEIILVDDGSPDKCPQMCDEWGLRDSRIKVLHKKNGGLGSARNAGLAIATGTLISFVDSDDWCEPDMLETMVATYKQTGTPIVICNVWVDWECGWPSEEKIFSEKLRIANKQECRQNFFSGKLTSWAWNKVYHRSLICYLQYPDRKYEDIPVFRELVLNAVPMSFSGESSYHYVQREASIVNSKLDKSHFVLLWEMEKNVEIARNFGKVELEWARLRLVKVAYDFLLKIYEAGKDGYEKECRDVRNFIAMCGDVPFEKLNLNKCDRSILNWIARGRDPFFLLYFRERIRKIYHLLGLKSKTKI